MSREAERYMYVYDAKYRCRCGWEGYEHELWRRLEFAGNMEEPPEYSEWCPCCNESADFMEEIDDE